MVYKVSLILSYETRLKTTRAGGLRQKKNNEISINKKGICTCRLYESLYCRI